MIVLMLIAFMLLVGYLAVNQIVTNRKFLKEMDLVIADYQDRVFADDEQRSRVRQECAKKLIALKKKVAMEKNAEALAQDKLDFFYSI